MTVLSQDTDDDDAFGAFAGAGVATAGAAGCADGVTARFGAIVVQGLLPGNIALSLIRVAERKREIRLCRVWWRLSSLNCWLQTSVHLVGHGWSFL